MLKVQVLPGSPFLILDLYIGCDVKRSPGTYREARIGEGPTVKTDYLKERVEQLWRYHDQRFGAGAVDLDQPRGTGLRPPVFRQACADLNLIQAPGASAEVRGKVVELLPHKHRHRWFRSMRSSQALGQSVFANLVRHGRLEALNDLVDDEGEPLFAPARLEAEVFRLELDLEGSLLGEPRPTSLDGALCFPDPDRAVGIPEGAYRVAMEFKFMEQEFGRCSRPRLTPKDSNYKTERCDGSLTHQLGRKLRCALAEIDVRYWEHVPRLFKWEGDADLVPCPLFEHYQLVRNVLATCARDRGRLAPRGGHAVVFYDTRNPAFCSGGRANVAFEVAKGALKRPRTLRKCSWQRLVALLREREILSWLTDALAEKYGF